MEIWLPALVCESDLKKAAVVVSHGETSPYDFGLALLRAWVEPVLELYRKSLPGIVYEAVHVLLIDRHRTASLTTTRGVPAFCSRRRRSSDSRLLSPSRYFE